MLREVITDDEDMELSGEEGWRAVFITLFFLQNLGQLKPH